MKEKREKVYEVLLQCSADSALCGIFIKPAEIAKRAGLSMGDVNTIMKWMLKKGLVNHHIKEKAWKARYLTILPDNVCWKHGKTIQCIDTGTHVECICPMCGITKIIEY
jgi:hypothetical protein